MENSTSTLFPGEYDLDQFLTVTPKRRGFSMRVAPRYIQHFVEQDFEGFSADLVAAHVRDVPLFIDIGAHYGFYALLAASTSPATRVLAFEPSPVNFAALRENITLNGFPNIEAHDLALSDSDGARTFLVAEASDSGGFAAHPLTRTEREISVNARRLDSLEIAGLFDQPALVKMDAEGHEIEILAGMRAALESNRRLELVIEFNPKCLRSAGHDPLEMLDLLAGLDYDVFFLDDAKHLLYKALPAQFAEWDRRIGNGHVNVLCIRRENSLSVAWFSHAATLTGGAEKSLTHLVESLQRVHHVLSTVIVPGEGPMREWAGRQAVGAPSMPPYSWWAKNTSRETAASLATILDKLDELRLINPDVIVTNTLTIPWGAIAAHFLHKPHVWFARELFEFEMGVTYNLPLEEIREIILGGSNQVVTLTYAIKESNFGSDPNVKVFYRPVRFQEPDANAPACFKDPQALKLLFAGGIREEKGIHDAVLAVKLLVQKGFRDLELVVIGPDDDPKLRQEIHRLVRKAKLEKHIHFLGQQEHAVNFIQQADLVLVCSKYNSFLRVTLEAAHLKKTVISSDNAGGRETVDENVTGLLYETGNPEDLAAKISSLAADPARRQELGENAFEFAHRNFNIETYEAKVHELFQFTRRLAPPNNPRLSAYIQHLMQDLIQQKDEYTQEITRSLAWSLALKIRKLRTTLAPNGSRLYKALLPLLRLVQLQ